MPTYLVATFFVFLVSGCTGFFAPTPPCEMDVWHRPVDALPAPPYTETNHTGDEFILIGIVRDANTCQPIPDATLMFDMTNHDGDYDGTQQGTTFTNALGLFAIQSNLPGAYGGGHPHIHLFIGAEGYSTITASYDFFEIRTWDQIEISLTEQNN